MPKSESAHPLDIFFRHNIWSNQLLFDACASLDAEQLSYTAGGTFGSIKATLGHITFAEERYIYHISSHQQMADTTRPDDSTSVSELRQRVEASGEILRALATTLDGTAQVKIPDNEGGHFMMPIEALLLQAIHHAHEHRTHIETMLGQLNITPPGLSAWRYHDEQMQ